MAEIYIELKKKGVQFPVPSDEDLLLVASMQPSQSPSHSDQSTATPSPSHQQSPAHSSTK